MNKLYDQVSLKSLWHTRGRIVNNDVVIEAPIHQEIDEIVKGHRALNPVALKTLEAVHRLPGTIGRVVAVHDVWFTEEIAIDVEFTVQWCAARDV